MKSLSESELLDLFKHWDTRVSHQEMLYVTLSSAPLAAVATSCKDIDPVDIYLLAVASATVYLFNLFIIRRFGSFQDNIFELLKEAHFTNWNAIVADRHGRIGVRRLRLLGLPLLGLIWSGFTVAKVGMPIAIGWQALLAAYLLTTALYTAWLWTETTPAN